MGVLDPCVRTLEVFQRSRSPHDHELSGIHSRPRLHMRGHNGATGVGAMTDG